MESPAYNRLELMTPAAFGAVGGRRSVSAARTKTKTGVVAGHR